MYITDGMGGHYEPHYDWGSGRHFAEKVLLPHINSFLILTYLPIITESRQSLRNIYGMFIHFFFFFSPVSFIAYREYIC